MNTKRYVLITPARNEEAYIEKTIQSVINQTTLPEKWIIVSDGSTDSTDQIVSGYAEKHAFIQLITAQQNGRYNFGSKVNAINEGYKYLSNVHYDFIGNIDADVSFEPSYFINILKEFEENQELGIAGGVISELVNGNYSKQNISLNSVAGAVQLFRRKCYESIGGYIPMRFGGIDAAAEILARVNGWHVRTLPEITVLHHRSITTGGKNIISTRFYQGLTNYLLGYHPLFHIASCLSRATERPYLIGSICLLYGYYWAFFKRYKRELPKNAIKYLRSEQMERLGESLLTRKRA